MKIKMLIPIALILCLAFSLCACGNGANNNETTTTPTTTATATEAQTEAATEADTNAVTDVVTTAPETEADTTSDFTQDDALELVKNTHELTADDLYYMFRGTYEIDGTSYYAVDLRKSIETSSTYMSTYFVTLDGSEIESGYIADEVGYIGTEKPSIEVTEENAVKVVEAAYDFGDDSFLKYRGVEEIDGTSYFVVDVMRSLETNVSYLSSYFVTADGTIVTGYYSNNVPTLTE